jgi:hypothetical protein
MKPKRTDHDSNIDKEIIILRHIGGRLGNQLWLFSNVYAYCLEKGYKCLNPSFYAYNKYYGLRDPNPLVKIFEYLNNFKINESHASSYFIYTLYKYCSTLIPLFQRGIIIKIKQDEKFNLPPSQNNKPDHKEIIELIESSQSRKVYLDSGEFENPFGIKKYRKQITDKFKPNENAIKIVDKFLSKFRNFYLVAVHIRQGDYKRFVKGRFYFSQYEVANILRYFIARRYKGNKKVKFILFSDSKIDSNNFSDLNTEMGFGPGFMIEDMLAMSKCNLIIASRSSFSVYAAYYGNKPLYTFDHKKMIIPFNIYENTIFT